MKTKQEMLDLLAERIHQIKWECGACERINTIRNFDQLINKHGPEGLCEIRALIESASPEEWREAAKAN